MPNPETVVRLKSLLTKNLTSNFREAFRVPTFPFTRQPNGYHNQIITPNTPVQLAHYKSIYQGPKSFIGMTMPLMRGTVYPKKKYSTIVPGRLNKLGCSYSSLSMRSTINWNYFYEEGHGARRCVGHFLMLGAVLVGGIVALGGLTRLTESGLSMVDWSLIHFQPPKSQEEWQAYFEKYQQFPEFQVLNRNMSLEEFKFIYYMEFAHRVYGRVLGLYFLSGSAFFILGKMVSPRIRNALMLVNGLVVFQGLLGWYMVKSGLNKKLVEDNQVPRVSQYRLAAHLGTASLILTVLLKYGFEVVYGTPSAVQPESKAALTQLTKFRRFAKGMAHAVFLTVLSGAFVAGLDAGLIYNTFPLMADRWIPSDMWYLDPLWKNFFENSATVQFEHRYLAIGTLAGITALFLKSRGLPLPPQVKVAINSLTLMVYIQATLGITTLLYVVPIPLASAHQIGAMGMLTASSYLLHAIRMLPK